jgi:hypothetical protein
MKQSIWKFPLEIKGLQLQPMPEGAKILCVETQNGQPCIWAMVDESAPTEIRTIEVFGTGHPIPRGEREYIGTFQMMVGGLVYHVFEQK